MNPEELTAMESETEAEATTESDATEFVVQLDDLLPDSGESEISPQTFGSEQDRRSCPQCGQLMPSGLYICDDCMDRFRRQISEDPRLTEVHHPCPICGAETPNGQCVCDQCWNEARAVRAQYYREHRPAPRPTTRNATYVHEYSYKPRPLFTALEGEPGERDTDLFLGVELEVDRGDDRGALVQEITKLGKPVYMKHDGSLGENGVEIVSHPCTLGYHLQSGMWEDITRVCREAGYKSHDTNTCGLHIHADREFLGDGCVEQNRTALRLVMLAYRLWPDLVAFSRRKPSRLDEWARRPDLVDAAEQPKLPLEAVYESVAEAVEDERYLAVNLCPARTVEFRLFRGTLVPETLYASLELVRNLVLYAKDHSAEWCLKEATFRDILNVAPTKSLSNYCASRGIPT